MRSVWATKCASSRADGAQRSTTGSNAGAHRCLPGLHGQNIGHHGFLRTPRTRSGERHLHGRRHPDLECMKAVGIPVCPSDAASEVIEASRYVSEFAGGHGCVRDIIEQVLPRQERLGPRFPGHAQLEYRRVAVKPKSNERGCLKLLINPFFITRKQQELTTIEPSSSGNSSRDRTHSSV